MRALARGGAIEPTYLPRTVRWRAEADGLRFDLAWPEGAPPSGGFPLIVVTDANAMFATLVEAVRLQALRPDVTGIREAVVLGIGHDIEGLFEPALRARDYAPPGAERLLGLLDSLLPELAGRLPLDPCRRTLVGHSLGGLFALHALFSRPALFSGIVAASPSIWWDRGAVADGMARLAQMLPRLASPLRVLLTAGGREQAPCPAERQDDPQFARLAERRVVEEAQDLARLLSGMDPARLRAGFHLFEGESHASVVPLALNRAARFALAPENPP